MGKLNILRRSIRYLQIGVPISAILVTALILLQSTHGKFHKRELRALYTGEQGVRLQSENNDCGPASLQMIFDYYGIQSAMDELKRDIRLNERGSTMLALKEMAELNGLHAEGWRLTMNDFSHISFPALLFVRDDHFVVVDSIRNDDIFMRDPAIGRLRVAVKQFTKLWKGEILLFRRE